MHVSVRVCVCVCLCVSVCLYLCVCVYRMLQNLARGLQKRNSLRLRELSRLAKSVLIDYRELSRGLC